MPKLNALVRQGAYLPHWTKEGATYHVRLRLADSLPQHVLREWREEKKEIIRKSVEENRSLTKDEQERLRELSSEKIERYLRQGYGACSLKRDDVVSIVVQALHAGDGRIYRLIAWCIMPNHVHVIVEPLIRELHRILNAWKSTTARKTNRLLGRRGPFWQVEYFDHLIRSEEDFCHSVEYVWNNPDEAGLRDWKWRWKKEDL